MVDEGGQSSRYGYAADTPHLLTLAVDPATGGGNVVRYSPGVQTTSPAAGFGAKPPTPGVVVPRPPVPGAPPVAQVPQNPENQNPQLQQLPPDVRQKLERMKQNPGNTRSGRGRH